MPFSQPTPGVTSLNKNHLDEVKMPEAGPSSRCLLPELKVCIGKKNVHLPDSLPSSFLCSSPGGRTLTRIPGHCWSPVYLQEESLDIKKAHTCMSLYLSLPLPLPIKFGWVLKADLPHNKIKLLLA